jgi:hypothetical protein
VTAVSAAGRGHGRQEPSQRSGTRPDEPELALEGELGLVLSVAVEIVDHVDVVIIHAALDVVAVSVRLWSPPPQAPDQQGEAQQRAARNPVRRLYATSVAGREVRGRCDRPSPELATQGQGTILHGGSGGSGG